MWRTSGGLLVDDRTHGVIDGRRVLLRQFTGVNGGQVMALLFRFIEPADEAAAIAESASIAAGWRIGAAR